MILGSFIFSAVYQCAPGLGSYSMEATTKGRTALLIRPASDAAIQTAVSRKRAAYLWPAADRVTVTVFMGYVPSRNCLKPVSGESWAEGPLLTRLALQGDRLEKAIEALCGIEDVEDIATVCGLLY